jgi:hypothetical protein
MSRFATVIASSVGSYGLMMNQEGRPGHAATVHIVGNSFNLTVKATNFFNYTTRAGSNWTDISSPITEAGIYEFPTYNYGAIVMQVNSAAAPVMMAVG